MMSTLRFEQLKEGQALSGRELEQLAALIYDTDPFIYPALFRSREQARRVLPAVFLHGGDNMFRLENCFTGWLRGELVSLILWSAGSLEWDDSALRAGLERDIEHVSPGYPQVRNEYFPSYRANPDAVVSIVNFCVDGRMRGRGVGGAMLRAFKREHPQNDMELFVLDSNPAAIRLYQREGFRELRKLDGFSLSAQKPLCVQMYRKKEDVSRGTELL